MGSELFDEAVNGAATDTEEEDEDPPILPMNHAGTQPRSPVSCFILTCQRLVRGKPVCGGGHTCMTSGNTSCTP